MAQCSWRDRLQWESSFFKLASTPGISRATRNEVRWNRHLSDQLPEEAVFHVPRIIRTGKVEDNFFYLAELVDGKPLYVPYQGQSSDLLGSQAKEFAHSLLDIAKIPECKLIWDSKYRRLKNPGEKYYRRALSFYNGITNQEELTSLKADLAPLLEKAQEIETCYQPGLAHGDFVPWHMLQDVNRRLILVDAEWSRSWLPKFYDLAYCYQRLFTEVNAGPSIAREMAGEYRGELSRTDRKFFDQAFRAC